jgi:hypothetical protein
LNDEWLLPFFCFFCPRRHGGGAGGKGDLVYELTMASSVSSATRAISLVNKLNLGRKGRIGSIIHKASISTSKVDPKEQEKFSQAAPEWWDSSSTAGAGLLHALNPIRVRYICNQVCTRHDAYHLK